ncbi:hypothetical protein EMIHUDRAFT_224298 [Emiliania huxleyi CCMP1516]|uniref:Exostosin GT47 domain-containing protein n=2 Tax=Emiliania huxleyi TaxID=2903 RepID=A0A0D3KS14_EMIH1|nr:hypothetical protein EMIHUDRAFT_224298 [Emiliania huxleyi CCMP1516]EOD38549.1 hypothetical protein EMIHUDRAFT_224298 [Emiliania huxleyi CCMP1516]|eukprot:XP_005790978.1 hypothetical protein EMIHUDRAFT_224298 [Emiliania huxleyi CCMP1516]
MPLPSLHAAFPAVARSNQAGKTTLAFFKGRVSTSRKATGSHRSTATFRACDSSGPCKYDYRAEMQRCKYGLVPRRGGALSYRLMEVMSAGGVPVMIGSAGGLLPPFAGMLRWEFFSVTVPNRDMRI